MARPIVEGGMQVINDALGPIAKEGGQLAGDLVAIAGGRVRAWKLGNFLRTADSARAQLAQRGISHRQLPNDFTVPWIEATANVENKLLGEMWAALLASEMVESSDRHKRFIPILEGMTPEEARLLHHAAPFSDAIQLPDGVEEAAAELTASSLKALGLLEVCIHDCSRPHERQQDRGIRYLGIQGTNHRLSPLAHEFLRATTPPGEEPATRQAVQ